MSVAVMTALAGWRDRHAGETIVVCGCGRSLHDLPRPLPFTTIGVNDVGRLFDPTYLVVLNPKSQFAPDRFAHVVGSRAAAIFTQLDLRAMGVAHQEIVRFRLGRRAGTDLAQPDTLPYTRNSPYVAVCLAAFMGAARIGVIGVDFTDHHFFAADGRHPLTAELATIDREYAALAAMLAQRGVELVNLSRDSRLRALPKADLNAWLGACAQTSRPAAAAPAPRIFFVHYQFISCGDVFTQGLEQAARELQVEWESAAADAPQLPAAVERFAPDLLFVVHGRRFRQRWGTRPLPGRSAVWLLDEPYEIDDTQVTSRLFDVVFVNDRSTMRLHRNAHYLPVGWDPSRHTSPGDTPRRFAVGFIGGGNPTREAMLERLAREGLLSYVVGGPWKSPALRRLSLGTSVPAARAAELYRETRIVVNVFRDQHHFNRRRVPATSLNPRVYEALACGALVVSEQRPELDEVFPDVPSFRDADGLAVSVRALLADEERRGELLAASRARLGAHTYAERLRAALAAALPAAASVHAGAAPIRAIQWSDPMPDTVPTFTIAMVVHDSLDMTRVAVSRTLQHSRESDARLVVVDNASSDGTREWLRLLAGRGDLDLIELPRNAGHGPGLEVARQRTRSRFLVTLDSDAFPLVDDWLVRLRGRLDEGAMAAGILHHRNYIHPSCLMVARDTLDRLGVTLLDEKDRPSRLDVAERLSVEILRGGGRIAGLSRTSARRRGSAAEPVFLGSSYEGVVYHQWYTTRAAGAPGRDVDDVPRAAIDRSLAEAIDEDRREPRDATVVLTLRLDAGDRERRRNAIATLTALAYQDVPRYTFRVVLVEQGAAPGLAREFAPYVDRYLFAYNPGAFNRGWGFNVGAALAAGAAEPLGLLDADLLVPPDFVRRGVAAVREGARAVLPYRAVRHLDAASTTRAIEERMASRSASPDPDRFAGRLFTDSQGGALWVDMATYRRIGGHDERFRGWGCEDREICRRLALDGAGPTRLDGTLLHLDHPRPPESDADARANHTLLAQLSRERSAVAPGPFGDPGRYGTPAAAAAPAAGRRGWEHWNGWTDERISAIVDGERVVSGSRSCRRELADLAASIGSRVLDAGCGPGALWLHFLPHRPRLRWCGSDVTAMMLRGARHAFADVPLVQADAGQMPWVTGGFDVVVLRHVLEHLPPWLMQQALNEAMRVAARAVLVAFYVPPSPNERVTRDVGEGFLETQWASADIESIVTGAAWTVRDRRRLVAQDGDEVWILAPSAADGDLFRHRDEVALARRAWPKISIVMPTFRRPHRLAATVATVLAQTYGNWELIVVDNAGDCGCRFDDPRIVMRVHADRASAAHARNAGLQFVTGDLVCFFDDDDDMFPTYLQQFADAFRAHPSAKMVRCGMIVSGGRVDYSFATPEICLRREFATPTWRNDGPAQDQLYYKRIVARYRWKGPRDVVTVKAPLCRANSDPRGGLRAGAY